MNNQNNSKYLKLGVSSKKEDVHQAIKNGDKGLFPGAFCKIVEDIAGNKNYCSIFHEDGAGTKSNLAYMYYRETGDSSVFKGIVHDAIVMNIDDIMCVGTINDIFLSNTITRNSKLVSGDIVSTIIKEYEAFSAKLSSYGIRIITCGGETEDLGDIVKTISLFASVFTRMKRKDIIDADNINESDVIIGLASFGKSAYEEEYNTGISSNGLTLARHGTLQHNYYKKYPECYDQNLDEDLIFYGKYDLIDKIEGLNLDIGKALLSPTRTYAPVILDILNLYKKDIHALIHITGGGQTKTLNFGKGIKYVKNNLFKLPKIFEIIQESSKTSWEEMYSVFNMGHRLEIYCHESFAKEIIKIAKKFNIEGKVIGFCEKSSNKNRNSMEVSSDFGSFKYF
jgi:phosphoribosylformylglycinamidine cyclo-ligase